MLAVRIGLGRQRPDSPAERAQQRPAFAPQQREPRRRIGIGYARRPFGAAGEEGTDHRGGYIPYSSFPRKQELQTGAVRFPPQHQRALFDPKNRLWGTRG